MARWPEIHADRLTSDHPASGTSATFTFDALGRFRTRVLSAGGTGTYGYLGTGEQVVRIPNSGGTTTDSIVDPAGNRRGESGLDRAAHDLRLRWG